MTNEINEQIEYLSSSKAFNKIYRDIIIHKEEIRKEDIDFNNIKDSFINIGKEFPEFNLLFYTCKISRHYTRFPIEFRESDKDDSNMFILDIFGKIGIAAFPYKFFKKVYYLIWIFDDLLKYADYKKIYCVFIKNNINLKGMAWLPEQRYVLTYATLSMSILILCFLLLSILGPYNINFFTLLVFVFFMAIVLFLMGRAIKKLRTEKMEMKEYCKNRDKKYNV